MPHALIFAAVLGFAHYISNRFRFLQSKYQQNVISLIAGISLTYLLLVLLPDFYTEALLANKLILFFVLLGFALFHLVDKFIYQKIDKAYVKKDIRIAHGIGIVFYYFVIGFVLSGLSNISLRQGLLFFVPIMLYAIVSNVYSVGVRGIRSKELLSLNFIQSVAPLAGVALAMMLVIPAGVLAAFVGIVAGMWTFIIVRDVIPYDEKGKPVYFIMGVILYALVIVISWSL